MSSILRATLVLRQRHRTTVAPHHPVILQRMPYHEETGLLLNPGTFNGARSMGWLCCCAEPDAGKPEKHDQVLTPGRGNCDSFQSAPITNQPKSLPITDAVNQNFTAKLGQKDTSARGGYQSVATESPERQYKRLSWYDNQPQNAHYPVAAAGQVYPQLSQSAPEWDWHQPDDHDETGEMGKKKRRGQKSAPGEVKSEKRQKAASRHDVDDRSLHLSARLNHGVVKPDEQALRGQAHGKRDVSPRTSPPCNAGNLPVFERANSADGGARRALEEAREAQEADAGPALQLVPVTPQRHEPQEAPEEREVAREPRPVPVTCQPYDLNTEWGIGSMVCIKGAAGSQYGLLRWMGTVKGKPMVGLELEAPTHIGNDGSLLGHKLFHCAPYHGVFVRLETLQPDNRFDMLAEASMQEKADGGFEPLVSEPVMDYVQPSELVADLGPISGRWKGIQGHYNSCYLDSTLYSMFAFSDVFDALLSRLPEQGDVEPLQEVQRILQEDIVNPLRKNNYVSHDKVLHLREILDTVGALKGLTHEEKDPEEFLKCLLEEALRCPPLLTFSNGQDSHYYQVFCDKEQRDYQLPTIQQLIELSFFQADIQLTKVPECFFIQMPRFGKEFRLFKRILPSLELDITDLLTSGLRCCRMCGQQGSWECRTCFETSPKCPVSDIVFCDECHGMWHRHPDRQGHQLRELKMPRSSEQVSGRPVRQKMELFAVICIETSHYISFVKCGRGPTAPWVFVDSMADRIGGHDDGYNIPEVIPFDMNVISGPEVEKIADERMSLPEHLHRLVSDGYMSLYRPI